MPASLRAALIGAVGLSLLLLPAVIPSLLAADEPAAERDFVPQTAAELLAPENLTAWLVMFTDPTRRTVEERAEMVARHGFRKVGFEAFPKYVPLLEEQMEAYSQHGIETTCVYMVIETQTPSKEAHVTHIFDVLERRGETPDIWAMFSRNSFKDVPEQERMEKLIEAFSDLARRAEKSGCKLAIYNYGSWFGEVDVQLGVIEGIRGETGIDVGTVLNFHRGHHLMDDFPEALRRMMPHLVAVNINGMNSKDAGYRGGGAKILPVGQGDYEQTMLQQLFDAGYRGPIGIIDHRNGIDADTALSENLQGVARLRRVLASDK
ncbi:Xylose isomerase-like TIM barrel [Maioricimonas rarisocia]|uniref:Xylose isomerase-like TIM barrel n=1 Tax=Maioricimonas rarisocia TaxID=2528026 RepID=A0A517ZAT7_9PLAN|nr:TIM barrel protein [Maioricimonas rarisocia]QDU39602.1 Xylose isomerase-like TIM barrel [Maioricimonas rarisocia]